MSKKFGKTWWGEQWLNSLNNIDYNNRLSRGSSYASKGAVTSIEIQGNQIHALVAGSRPKPYNVQIILPPFFDPQLNNFVKAISERPVIISKLLNRELDTEVLGIAENMGLKVFPKQWTDFKMQCSCPDWAVPCKHLAAVIYKISAEIDNNPFLVFELHKVNLVESLGKLGILISRGNTEIPQIKDLYFDNDKGKDHKYHPENAYQKPEFSSLTPINDHLAALLTDFPAFYQGSGNFKDKYKDKLNNIVRNTRKIVQGKVKLEHLFLSNSIKEQQIRPKSYEKISVNKQFQTKVYINNNSFSLRDFLSQLSNIESHKLYDYQPSTASLYTVLQFSIHLLANGAVVPQIVQLENGAFTVRWLPAMLSKEISTLMKELELMLPPDIFLWEENKNHHAVNKNTALNLVSLCITEIISAITGPSDDDLFISLFFCRKKYDFKKPGEEALSGGIMVWLQKYFISQGKYTPQLIIEELINNQFKISINILEKNTLSLDLPLSLKDILNNKKYDRNRYEILSSLAQLSSFIPMMDAYINSRGKTEMIMDNTIFTPFLLKIIPAIQLLDVPVLLPKSLQHILKPKVSVKIKRKKEGKSFLRLDQLLTFEWQVALGESVMSEAEFKKLLKKSDGLIRLKTGFMYADPHDLEKIYRHFSEATEPSAFELLRAALSEEYGGAKAAMNDEVKKMIRQLANPEKVPLPQNLKAQLRPYQHRGYSWMYHNARLGFGSVLADDMGLGKTLQTITLLQKYKEEKMLLNEKALVIAPTGLLTNWQAEVEKFAPSLKSTIYHGTGRTLKRDDEFDVIITSYGIIRSDVKFLKNKKWYVVIIDEAQNIKNIITEQTKAVKSIPANHFIALSGTPVENRLSELWSIVDYCNRGFLGSMKEFADNYGIPIQQYNDIQAAEKLKKVNAPFLMRRLKTDKSIISDLPDKIEMDCFANLSKEQAGLYEKTLQEAMEEIEGIVKTDRQSLFVRQGLVLQMILALKQVCNHPAQFLKNGIYHPELSGKVSLLFDKLDSITQSNEKVLIFTQFTQMGKLLNQFITKRYEQEPLFYHGGLPVKARKTMVNNFQQDPADKIFILSLKAAGTGLNLTRANHVIHYDLWWNPAVEAQATDRAYRIGQKNNVMVHRFITKNTFEERINEMIQSKKALAEMTVSTGETWIGNLSNHELRNLFTIT